MVSNYMCMTCEKIAVCKIYDIIAKFDEDSKKQLGVDLTMDGCSHCVADVEESSNKGDS